ncbi:HK97 family phage prohead protease [Microbacterium jejuense]|uniref:HK97 family phage prohead protease n=1 Tax=Microbacterium jejuense TaxID=1263637 RepID=A0ABS7HQB4_9MICO|nr:HK97 family phage prohead protease [Microbacterium jejuense]MBW9094634.1 HK97 family phage prohead protease [Microbacterium jejuense]
MTFTATMEADIAGRRAACSGTRAIPSSELRSEAFAAQLRSSIIEQNGKEFVQLEGVASVVDTWYEMYDFWGPYSEKVARGAFDKTLAAMPDVAFLLNHRGMTMARTKVSRTLTLWTDDAGSLAMRALLNAQRQDVQDLRHAVDDGDVDQMSFAFRITDGNWNMDFTEFTITEVDLDRGDVSAVNYGANPYTSISARSKQALASVDDLPVPVLRALVARGQERLSGADVDQASDATVEERTQRSAASLALSAALARDELRAAIA